MTKTPKKTAAPPKAKPLTHEPGEMPRWKKYRCDNDLPFDDAECERVLAERAKQLTMGQKSAS